MCSELLRIPLEVAGVPLFSGILMVAWLAISGYGMIAAWRIDGWKSVLVGHVPTLLVGAAMLLFLPRYFPDGVPVRGYGVMLVVGCSAAVALATWRARDIGIEQDEILRLAIAMFVAGIVGGRAFYVVEYWADQFPHRRPSNQADRLGSFAARDVEFHRRWIGRVRCIFGNDVRVSSSCCDS